MELEDNDVTTYIDDMIAVLQDRKELINMAESKSAVDKLRELKREDFVITTTNAAEIHKALMADIKHITEEVENKFKRKGEDVGDQVASIGTKQQTNLEQKGKVVSKHVEDIGTKQTTSLEQKGKIVGDQVASIGTKQKTILKQKGNEVRHRLEATGTKQRADLVQKGMEVSDHVMFIGTKVGEQVAGIGTKQKTDLEQKGKEVSDKLETKGKKLKAELEQKHSHDSDKKDLTNEVGLVQHAPDYSRRKSEYKKKLVDDYMQYAMQVSSVPLQPESNQTDIENVYVSPWMVEKKWDENSRQIEEPEISMHEMFHDVDKPVRNIYVLGEAGTGETTFCKMLAYYWCVAHSERKATASESSAVKVMENYDFLFYVSLRHYSELNKIENMLEEIYPDPVLRTLLQNESDKCLILLDGLDEWMAKNQRPSQFFTRGLPTRDLGAKYTIITTTRRWKFDTLRIKDSEIDKKIKLKGIRGTAVTQLTKSTVKTLNETFHKNKSATKFLLALRRIPVADVSHVPIILQQLICLWFDGKLGKTSECAIYSSMLDLFFNWKTLKYSENIDVSGPVGTEIGNQLPEYLKVYESCFENKHVIYHLAHLAYKTLFDRNKESTLTFSNSTFQQLNIPGDVKTCSLKVGILSEDQNINLFASTRQHTSFSFVHKSMQEYLTAVYVAIQFEEIQKGGEFLSENSKQCVRNHFRNCETVADILEQSNVFIMLCGLEPQLLPFISECIIYNITTEDKQMIVERKIAKDYFSEHKNVLKNYIQKCILSCVSEALSRFDVSVQFENGVYIADIVLNPTEHIASYLRKKIFNLSGVLSVDIDLRYDSSENMNSVLNLLTECDSLETFKCNGGRLPLAADEYIKSIEQHTDRITDKNKSTLKTVSFIGASKQIVKNLVRIMPSMSCLISFRLSKVTVSHNVCESLCTVFEKLVHLEQISLDIYCRNRDRHTINLTKHEQLQYLNLRFGRIHASSVNTDNLDTYILPFSSNDMMEQMCKSLYNARKLKHLVLHGSSNAANGRSISDCLVRLLPSLTSLSTVKLRHLTFTDSIITHPSDMKNLKEIKLFYVTMSMKSWCAFVDSLPKLPQTVQVDTWDLTLEDKKGGRAEAERQYVRKETKSFRVIRDDKYYFVFVTVNTKSKRG